MADISAITSIDGVTYTIKDATARESLVPSGGTTGQVLTKTANGYDWQTGGGGGGVWGSITGTLSDQTDLQTALNAAKDIFIITVQNMSSPSHTQSEIYQALQDGKLPVVFDTYAGATYYFIGEVGGYLFLRPITSVSGTSLSLYGCRISGSDAIPFADTKTLLSQNTVNVTLAAASWSGDSYTITNGYIYTYKTITLTYPADTSDSDYAMLKAADIRPTAVATGSLTIKALGTVPTSDLTITLVLVG